MSKSKSKSKLDLFEKSKSNNIKHLNKSDFEISDNVTKTKINKHNNFGILFVYVEWCPYCVNSVNVIKDLALELKEFDLPLYVSNHTKTKYLPFVKSFPSIYFINEKGNLKEMNSDRTVLSLFNLFINYIVQTMNPNAQIKNKKDLIQNEDIDLNMNNNLEKILMNTQLKHQNENTLYNNSRAIQLSAEDFDINTNGEIIMKSDNFNKGGLLTAYANWCGYCQNSASKIKTLSNTFNENKDKEVINIYVIEMSNSSNNGLNQLNELNGLNGLNGLNELNELNPLNRIVKGFPTYLLVNNSKKIDILDSNIIENQDFNSMQKDTMKQIIDYLKN